MQLSPEQKSSLDRICSDFGIKLLLLHGSMATGKARPDSDIDIGFFSHREDLTSFLALHSALYDVFKENRELDLHSLHRTDPLFKFQIAKNAKLLFGTENDFNDFRVHAFFQYHDSLDLRELERSLIKKQQIQWSEKSGK